MYWVHPLSLKNRQGEPTEAFENASTTDHHTAVRRELARRECVGRLPKDCQWWVLKTAYAAVSGLAVSRRPGRRRLGGAEADREAVKLPVEPDEPGDWVRVCFLCRSRDSVDLGWSAAGRTWGSTTFRRAAHASP